MFSNFTSYNIIYILQWLNVRGFNWVSHDINKRYQPELNYNFSEDFLSDFLLPFILGKYIVCDIYRLKFRSFESDSVLYIIPSYRASMQELVMQVM